MSSDSSRPARRRVGVLPVEIRTSDAPRSLATDTGIVSSLAIACLAEVTSSAVSAGRASVDEAAAGGGGATRGIAGGAAECAPVAAGAAHEPAPFVDAEPGAAPDGAGAGLGFVGV